MFIIPKYFKNIFQKAENEIPDNILEYLKEFHDSRDEKENKATYLPPDEQISIRGIWVIEAYPPSHIDNLFHCINNLGWNNSGVLHRYEDINIWLKDVRQSSFCSSLNIGYLRENATNFQDKYAPMPDGFIGAWGTILQIIPSTTFLIMRFLLNPENERLLENHFLKDYSTYPKRFGKSFRYITPAQQKREAIRNNREELHGRCYKWFLTHAPGIFSSGAMKGMFPTCEFITTKIGKPFLHKWKNIDGDYMQILNLHETFSIWQSKDFPGITLGLPISHEECTTPYYFDTLVFAGNDKEIFPDLTESTGHKRGSFGYHIALENLDIPLGLWSLFLLTKTYEDSLSKLRDTTINLEMGNIKNATMNIRNINKDFVELEKDVPFYLSELEKYCNSNLDLHKNTIEFKPVKSYISKHDFFENIRLSIIEETNYLKDLRRNINDVIMITMQNITVISNDTYAKSNIRLSRLMILLTIIIVLLTIVKELEQIKGFIKYFWSFLVNLSLVY